MYRLSVSPRRYEAEPILTTQTGEWKTHGGKGIDILPLVLSYRECTVTHSLHSIIVDKTMLPLMKLLICSLTTTMFPSSVRPRIALRGSYNSKFSKHDSIFGVCHVLEVYKSSHLELYAYVNPLVWVQFYMLSCHEVFQLQNFPSPRS